MNEIQRIIQELAQMTDDERYEALLDSGKQTYRSVVDYGLTWKYSARHEGLSRQLEHLKRASGLRNRTSRIAHGQ